MIQNSLQAYYTVEMGPTDGKGRKKNVTEGESHRLFGESEHERKRRKEKKEKTKGTKSPLLCN